MSNEESSGDAPDFSCAPSRTRKRIADGRGYRSRVRATPLERLAAELGKPVDPNLRALTFWRPWTDAILHGGKRVENRLKPPPAALLGHVIVIHAGLRYELGDWTRDRTWEPPRERDCPTGLVGTARILGWFRKWPIARGGHGKIDPGEVRAGTPFPWSPGALRETYERLLEVPKDPWFAGPVGWLLGDVRAFDNPIPCSGAMGLWRVRARLEKEAKRG